MLRHRLTNPVLPTLSILLALLLPATAAAACFEAGSTEPWGVDTKCGDKSQLGFEGNSNLMRIGPSSGTCNLVRRYTTPAGSGYAWRIRPTGLSYHTVINLKSLAGFTNFRTVLEGRNDIDSCHFDLDPECRDEHDDPVANPTDWSDCDRIVPRSGNTCPLSYYAPADYETCIAGTSAPSSTPECINDSRPFQCRITNNGALYAISAGSLTTNDNRSFWYLWTCGTRKPDGSIGSPYSGVCDSATYAFRNPTCDTTKKYGCTPTTASIKGPADYPRASVNFYHRKGQGHIEGAEAVHKVRDTVKSEYRWKCLMYHGTAPGTYENASSTLPGSPARVSAECTLPITGPECDESTRYGCDSGTVQESSKTETAIEGPPAGTRYQWRCEDVDTGTSPATRTYSPVCEKEEEDPVPEAVCGDTKYECEKGVLKGERGGCVSWVWDCESADGTQEVTCDTVIVNECRSGLNECRYNFTTCSADRSQFRDLPDETRDLGAEGTELISKWECLGGNRDDTTDDASDCEFPGDVTPPAVDGICNYNNPDIDNPSTAKCNDPVTPTSIDTSETYRMSWTCPGSNGGTTDNCEVIDGKCDLSTLNACTSGDPANQVDGDNTWDCLGINGGANDEGCTEPIDPPPDEICGTNDNIDDGCADANYDWVNVDGPSWQCKHSVSGDTVDCNPATAIYCGLSSTEYSQFLTEKDNLVNCTSEQIGHNLPADKYGRCWLDEEGQTTSCVGGINPEKYSCETTEGAAYEYVISLLSTQGAGRGGPSSIACPYSESPTCNCNRDCGNVGVGQTNICLAEQQTCLDNCPLTNAQCGSAKNPDDGCISGLYYGEASPTSPTWTCFGSGGGTNAYCP